ncbi:hypothetical protein G6F43_004101 [Rhizopus delemar]|nr:hypothetical protein G6F43_004101 [Rhizopus delemar]
MTQQLVRTHKEPSLLEDTIIGIQYKVGKRIGEGSFGIIYEGINLLNNESVAIKFESKDCEVPQLKDEYRAYKLLGGTVGVPNAYYFGQERKYNVLVIDLLGPNLEDMFEMCERRFSIKTVALLAIHMITLIQSVHEKGLVFRDIKPDNFLLGKPGTRYENDIYIIDFGMAKLYKHPRTHQHISYREGKNLTGTARYMSINTHLGREQSRRDDLEALGHVFMYFLRGSLPWQGLKAATNKQKYEKIGETKQAIGIQILCEGYPDQFAKYLRYVRQLDFAEDPDYNWLKSLFFDILQTTENDQMYDWMLLSDAQNWQSLTTEERKRWVRKRRHQMIKRKRISQA